MFRHVHNTPTSRRSCAGDTLPVLSDSHPVTAINRVTEIKR